LAPLDLALDEVVVRAFPQRGNPQLFVVLPGEKNDARAARQRNDSAQSLQAGLVRQP
jgi:hypothetical protein